MLIGNLFKKIAELAPIVACVATVAGISGCCVSVLNDCPNEPAKQTKVQAFPTVGEWQPITGSGAPEFRYSFELFWTGAEVLVIGGRVGNPSSFPADGGLYDTANDSWRPLKLPEEFSANLVSNARYLWADDRLYVMAPDSQTTEKAFVSFDPKTSDWTDLATDGLPRKCTAIVWTGDQIQKSCEQVEPFEEYGQNLVSYDAKTNAWTRQVTTGFPKIGHADCSVWTGSEWLIWASTGSDPTETKGLYSGYRLARGKTAWVAAAPGPDVVAVADSAVCVWTGTELAVYALSSGGALYNPTTDSWRLMDARFGTDGALVWTGTKLIAVSGGPGAAFVYDPASGEINQTPSRGETSGSFAATWAGVRLVVWGGKEVTNGQLELTNVGAVLILPP